MISVAMRSGDGYVVLVMLASSGASLPLFKLLDSRPAPLDGCFFLRVADDYARLPSFTAVPLADTISIVLLSPPMTS